MLAINRLTLKTAKPELIACTPIEPVPAGVDRPLWSVMIPTYNRTKYLENALRSVLDQAPGPDEMQIEVIDNCSTEADTEAVVRRVGQNRVSFYRQSHNVGLTANMTTSIKRAQGHLVHILHDDDAVMPGFYKQLQEAFQETPSIGAAFCRCVHDFEEYNQQSLESLESETPGILSNWLERIFTANRIQVPAVVVKRSVYEDLGGFHSELCQNIDWEMWRRIAAHYPIWYQPQALAYYRVHASSNTSKLVRSGENIVDQRRSIEICQAYLPQPIANKLSNRAREACALYALDIGRRALLRGDRVAGTSQIREALKSSLALRVVGTLALLPARIAMTTAKRALTKKKEMQLKVS